jgi:hypothetical protein
MVVDDLLNALGAGGTREASELLLSLARELQCGVLVGASDMAALLAAHRVLCFDGDGGIVEIHHHRPHRRIPGDSRTQPVSSYAWEFDGRCHYYSNTVYFAQLIWTTVRL